jgi:hypothetical protein
MLKSLSAKSLCGNARVIICYPFSVIGKTSVVGQAFLLANSDSRDGKRERLPYSDWDDMELVGQALPLAGLAGRNARPTIAVTRARARQCAATKKTTAARIRLKMQSKVSIRRCRGVAYGSTLGGMRVKIKN